MMVDSFTKLSIMEQLSEHITIIVNWDNGLEFIFPILELSKQLSCNNYFSSAYSRTLISE